MKVGDRIPLDVGDIPEGVSAVVERGGTTWRRAVGDERFVRLPSGQVVRTVQDDGGRLVPATEYDWISDNSSWRTTQGILEAARRESVPLRIVAVT